MGEFVCEFNVEKLRLAKKNRDDSKLSKYFQRDLESYSEKVQDETLKRVLLITTIENQIVGGWTKKNLEPIIESLPNEFIPKPSWRTIARWYGLFIASDRLIGSLIPKTNRCGSINSKTSDRELHFFNESLTYYLTPEKPTAKFVYDKKYVRKIVLENQDPTNEPIEYVSYEGFLNRIHKLDPYAVMVAREGKVKAERQYRVIGQHIPPSRILERVEIDHTPLDLVVLDDDLMVPLGRPYLTTVIDVYSSCILGFYISFNEPSYLSVKKALEHAIKPKGDIRTKYGTKNDWPCFGKFDSMVVDNGAEFWSKDLHLACLELTTDIQFCPVAKPYLKPLVERMYKLINDSFLIQLPGKTFENILAKGDYDPVKQAVLPFSSLIQMLNIWIVDDYHQSITASHTKIPRLFWDESANLFPPVEFSNQDLEMLDIILAKVESRKHNRKGILLNHIFYNSKELLKYRKVYGDRDVMIKFDPEDISYIYVFIESIKSDPNNLTYLKVPAIDSIGYTKGRTLNQHLIYKRFVTDYLNKKIDLVALAEAELRLSEVIDAAIEKLDVHSKAKISGMKRLAKLKNISSDNSNTLLTTTRAGNIDNVSEYEVIDSKPEIINLPSLPKLPDDEKGY